MIQVSHSLRQCFRPLGYLYQWAVQLRNFCFDQGWLQGKSYPIPIICVGNITVGGAGKTPHVELLLSLLSPRYRVAVLTRGYGRKTRGLVIATSTSTERDIGDEPRQMLLKYPGVTFAVDGNRCRAMDYLMRLPEGQRPEVVVMDDGFQHRYIRPTYSIVLVDATRPVWEERLLPHGQLREPLSALDRADCVIVTKCPTNMPPIEYRIVKRSLNLFPHQRIYFSRIQYLPLRSLLSLVSKGAGGVEPLAPPQAGAPVVQLTGIASPETFEGYLSRHYRLIDRWLYPDHYRFTASDVTEWAEQTRELTRVHPDWRAVCSEKDAVRLVARAADMPPELLARIYFLPIAVEVIDRESDFLTLIDRIAGGLPASRLFPSRYD